MCSPTQKVVSPTVQRLHYVGMTDEIIDDWLVTQSAALLFSWRLDVELKAPIF